MFIVVLYRTILQYTQTLRCMGDPLLYSQNVLCGLKSCSLLLWKDLSGVRSQKHAPKTLPKRS